LAAVGNFHYSSVHLPQPFQIQAQVNQPARTKIRIVVGVLELISPASDITLATASMATADRKAMSRSRR